MNSLLSPQDRSTLNENEYKEAFKTLNKDVGFLQVERYYADPAQMNQKISLFSFVPSKGAKPDKDGIYGMAKIRGVYATEEEANERAEFLIRNVDSFHDIYHTYVGRPFPVTNSDVFSQEVKTIDIRKKTTEIISEDIMEKKRQEQKEMKEIKEREKILLDESKRAQKDEPMDEFEEYITENVKRAQLIWTFHETRKKMDQMRESFINATNRIKELDCKNEDYKLKYKERYMEARRESGLPDDNESFIKFLGMDLNLTIDEMM